jgi:transposase-like protein
MDRIPPSQKLRQRIDDLLEQGLQGEENISSLVLRLGAERLLQELLEAESKEYLGRDHYERRDPGQEHRGYRNGYEPGRVRTSEGQVAVQVPQLRDTAEPYRSKIMEAMGRSTAVLERLVAQMYARGLSTRDIEAALEEATGEQVLSRSTVSRLSESLNEEYAAFCQRDLSGFEVQYLFLDAIYESLRRQGGGKEGLLCAWAICTDGSKALLHLALGNKESYANWLDFIRDLVRRGLNVPVLITTDGADGLIRAATEVFAGSLRQRCLAHKVRNVVAKVPMQAQAEVKAMVQAAYYAPNQAIAEQVAADVLRRFQKEYPSAMRSFQEDWPACIAYLRCPQTHHKRIRTTNLIERSFVEERRRTKVIPRFFTEESCLKLAFATLWQASQRWQGVTMTEFEIEQLALLRQELGIEDRETRRADAQVA